MRKIFFLTFFLQLLCLDLQLSSCDECGYPATRAHQKGRQALAVLSESGLFCTKVAALPHEKGKTLSEDVSREVMNGFTPELQKAIIYLKKFGYRVLIPIEVS